jgi:type IV pilus assembly protein PilA
MKKQQGFSLIELLVVVAIMLVIAAIAIPQVVAASQASNETAAVGTLKQVVSAQVGYHNLYGAYAPTAASLGGAEAPGTGCPSIPLPAGACFLADGIAKQLDGGTGAKAISGYAFKYTAPTDGQEYGISATPTSSYSGRKAFFVGNDGTVTYSTTITAAMTAPGTPLGQ